MAYEFERTPENLGHNTRIKLLFIRHASKNSETGLLTDDGRQASCNFWITRGIPCVNSEPDIFHSEIERSRETAMLIGNAVGLDRGSLFELKELSEYPLTDEFIGSHDLSGGKWLVKEIPHPEIGSTKDIAIKILRLVDNFVRLSEEVPNNTDKTIVLVSHIPPLMLFLRWVFVEEFGIGNDGESEILKKLGGFLKPLSGFEIDIARSVAGCLNLELIFSSTENNTLKVNFDMVDKLNKLSII